MENQKPFLTVEEQVELLRSRGMGFRDEDEAKRILWQESYYSVVNGYKDLFIDQERSKEAGEDRYKPGTVFEDLYKLFLFDRALREASFQTIVECEASMRNAAVYAFCDRYREEDSYLNRNHYCGAESFRDPDHYENELDNLMGHFESSREGKNRRPYVVHYLDKYGHVPLWVLVNTLTFGNVSHFYSILPRSIQDEACKIISKTQRVKRLSRKRLGNAFSALVEFRNICAHDERLYCARTGPRKGRYFSSMLMAMRRVMNEGSYSEFSETVARLVGLFDYSPDLKEAILREMRIEIQGEKAIPLIG